MTILSRLTTGVLIVASAAPVLAQSPVPVPAAVSPGVRASRPAHIDLSAEGGLYSLGAWALTRYGSASNTWVTGDMSLAVDLAWGVGPTRRTRLGLRASVFYVPRVPDSSDEAGNLSIAGAGVGFLLARSWFRLSPGFRVNHLWTGGADGDRLTAAEFCVTAGLDAPIYGPLSLRIAGGAGLWLSPSIALLGRLSLTGGAVLRL